MGFKDVLKRSFLETVSLGDISTMGIMVALLVTAALGTYIFFIYRILTKKTFYNKNFNVSLVALALITTAVILTIQSSVVISLGMVGALSIVRFRTAIKDPMDLVFLFWSISIGIICGAGLYEVAVITSILITVGIFVLNRIPIARAPMILVVNTADIDGEEAIMDTLEKYSVYNKVKSRNMSAEQLDMVIEVRVKEEAQLIREMNSLKGITTVSLLTHDGEVTF